MKKLLIIFAALMMASTTLVAQIVAERFTDEDSSLKYEITAVGETNTIKVISNDYTGISYTIPDTIKYKNIDFAVTEIGVYAFFGCSALQSIDLPASILKIREAAFVNCTSLQSITIPSNVMTIELGTFYNCSALQSITLSERLTTIEEAVFGNCSALQSITIPAYITKIEYGAFGNCSALQSVTFLGNACQDNIAHDAFDRVGTIISTLLVLPFNWTGDLPDQDFGLWYGGFFDLAAPNPKVGDTFMDENSGLKYEITAIAEIDSVKVVGYNCSNTACTVPAIVNYKGFDFAVTEIVESAFSDCSSLQSIDLPASVTTIGKYAFNECTSLKSINLPTSITTIEEGTFNDCKSLQSITIPASVTTIGDYAFNECDSLQSITIPAGVTTIGSFAFVYCFNINSVTFLGNACQNDIGYDAFWGVGYNTTATLTLPDNWTGSKPDGAGHWYGGHFIYRNTPMALIDVNANANVNKFLHKGQLLIRKNGKTYNALGVEL